MHNPWLVKKSKNKTPLRFRLGRPVLPVTPLQVTPSLPSWAFKYPRRTMESPGDITSRTPSRDSKKVICLVHLHKQQSEPSVFSSTSVQVKNEHFMFPYIQNQPTRPSGLCGMPQVMFSSFLHHQMAATEAKGSASTIKKKIG